MMPLGRTILKIRTTLGQAPLAIVLGAIPLAQADTFQLSSAYFPRTFVQSLSVERRFLEVETLTQREGGRARVSPELRKPSPLGWKLGYSWASLQEKSASAGLANETQSTLVLGMDWHWDDKTDVAATVRMSTVPVEAYQEGVIDIEWGSYRLWDASEASDSGDSGENRRSGVQLQALPPGESEQDDPVARQYLDRLMLLQAKKRRAQEAAQNPSPDPALPPGAVAPEKEELPEAYVPPPLVWDTLWLRLFLSWGKYQLDDGKRGVFESLTLGPKLSLELDTGRIFRFAALYTHYFKNPTVLTSGLTRSWPKAPGLDLSAGAASVSALMRGFPVFQFSADAIFPPGEYWSYEVGTSFSVLQESSIAVGARAQATRSVTSWMSAALQLQGALGTQSAGLATLKLLFPL